MEKKNERRKMKGVVVSTKMDKTAVVRVDRTSIHPKYKVRFSKSTKYKAHDPENAYKEGDIVIIEEARPQSKGKRWRIESKVEKKK